MKEFIIDNKGDIISAPVPNDVYLKIKKLSK
jgi:hypothetical protein